MRLPTSFVSESYTFYLLLVRLEISCAVVIGYLGEIRVSRRECFLLRSSYSSASLSLNFFSMFNSLFSRVYLSFWLWTDLDYRGVAIRKLSIVSRLELRSYNSIPSIPIGDSTEASYIELILGVIGLSSLYILPVKATFIIMWYGTRSFECKQKAWSVEIPIILCNLSLRSVWCFLFWTPFNLFRYLDYFLL